MSKPALFSWSPKTLTGLGIALIATVLTAILSSSLVPDLTAPVDHEHLHGFQTPFFDNILKVYTPRRACMFYEQDVIWLHLISDLLISLAYFSIPIALIYFIRKRRDLAFSWMFLLFAAFILLCGTTHIVGVLDLWYPLYRVDGIIKFLTAAVSIVTAIGLWPLIPKALQLPSPAMLEQRVQQRTEELAAAHADRKQALEREHALRKEAERANKIKDEFLATLSHELRTPLNAILGWTQVLKRKASDESLTEGLDIIERNTRAQSHLVEDLLDMSRIITGKLRLDVQRVDLGAVIESAIATTQPAAQAKGIAIQKIIDPLAGPVTGDPARLQQVVWNLLTNAVKFTPKGGKIQVRLERVNSHLEITVADNGIGIDPQFLPHLFERFSQSDSSITRSFGGLGLGLAIVRHLVELHGGTIVGKSLGKDQGSTFVISLPLRAEVSSPDSERGAHPTSPRHDTKAEHTQLEGALVLAVDDEIDSVLLMKMLLEEAGARVLTASTAAAAYELIKQHKPNILLCDIGMPAEDGYSFIRRVRLLSPEEGGAIPAIAVTAFARTEDRTNAMRAGFQLHVAKPFEATELLACVANLLSRRAN